MKEVVTMKIEKRIEANSRASRRLRKTGYLPGIICEKGSESLPIKMKEEEFRRNLLKYGRNYVFNLDLPGEKKHNVLVKEIQYAPISGKILNVDFQKISLTEEVKIDLGIRIIGREALDSRKLILIRQMDTIPVKGLPQDIPDNVEIDVSGLDEGESISIKDLNLPKAISVDLEEDQTVLSVNVSDLNVESKDIDESEAHEISDIIEETNEEFIEK